VPVHLGVLYWFNVSESSGASSPGLSWIKDHQTDVGVVVRWCKFSSDILTSY